MSKLYWRKSEFQNIKSKHKSWRMINPVDFLRENLINIFSMNHTCKFDIIPFDKNPNAIIPNFYPKGIFVTFELF